MSEHCPICRDLQPVGCPGCGLYPPQPPIMNVNERYGRAKLTWIDKLNVVCPIDVEYEIFRNIGEPYPDEYGYYPSCNEG